MKNFAKWRARLGTPLFLAVVAAAAVWAALAARQTAGASNSEGLRIAEQAVRNAAVSCYALEGAYPDSWESLREKSGIAVDENTYAVYYDVFASNIMPGVTVVERQAGP